MRSRQRPLRAVVSVGLVAAGSLTGAVVTAAPAHASVAPTVPAQLLRVSDLSLLNPTSPDPSGIVWMPDRQRLMISDGEVEEMPLYAGTNLYETTLQPTVTKRGTTVPGHHEPTGVAYNPGNGHLFTSNDDLKRVDEYVAGPDGTFGTSDDSVSTFSTAAFGNTDPEDVTYDAATGDLFIVDGLGAKVTRVSPGANGSFDGVSPVGDDTWSDFDLAILGAKDPEGIAYDAVRDTLLVVDDGAARIFEITRYGSLVNAIDIAALGTQAAAGITVAPRSGDAGARSYYVVDRGLDNNSHPQENDGAMFEVTANLKAVTNLPPWARAGDDLEIELPETANLAGLVTDDGQGNKNGIKYELTTTWSVLSGPGPVSFANASSAQTTASFTVPGTYTLRLTGDDGDLPDVDDVTVTVVEQGGVHTTAFPVRLGTDDAEEAATGFVSVTSADLELVDDGTINQTVGVRFADMSLPHGAVIETAAIQFQTDEVKSGPVSLEIHGEATDHAAGYQPVSGNITARSRTLSSASWSPPPWNTLFEAGPAQRTSDLGAIVQELVDRPGWSAGNAMSFLISGTGTRTAESRDGTAAPTLVVGWRRPIEDANRAPIVSAGPDQQLRLPAGADLAGTVTDDGLPTPPGATTLTWSKLSGPGTVSFATPAAEATSASFGAPGDYVLRLTADDGAASTSDDVGVTVLGTDAPYAATVPIAAEADDASEGGGGSGTFVNLNGADLELGTDVTASATFSTLVGMRYQLPVPAGAVIDQATIRFTADENSTGGAALDIHAQAADDAGPFLAQGGNLSARARTAASVPWSPPAWTTNASGPAQTTPDLAGVLQRVIDRPGWAAGNHAALLISGTGRRTAETFRSGAAKAGVLDLNWHIPAAETNRAPVATAGTDQEVQLPGAAALDGSVADDGLPTPPGATTVAWSAVSGPGTVAFGNAAAVSTTATFGQAGEYVLRLTADDGALQGTDDVTITVLAATAPQSATIPLASGADDATEGGGSGNRYVSITGGDLELGTNVTASSTYSTLVGLRYQLPVPAGAVVDSATVRFSVDEVSTGAADLVVQAVDSNDAAPFVTGAGNLSDRARTTAAVPWLVPTWPTVNASGPAQTTPDLAAVVQAVVDRPGWAEGGHVALMLSGTGRRTADSFEGGAAKAAVLDITWHLPG